MVRLHADPVAQNRAARIGARRIHSDDAHGTVASPVLARELVHQRAFAGSGRASQADDQRVSGEWKKRFQKLNRFRGVVLDGADSARQRPRISCAHAVDE